MASNPELADLVPRIRGWGRELGFQQVGVSDIRLDAHEERLEQWLDRGYHGGMAYMKRHGTKRSRPAELQPGTVRVISARMDYLPEQAFDIRSLMADASKGVVSRYALGRDYHKLMRHRLQTLARKIETQAGPMGYRVFVDSAPVLEKALAEKAGLGWIGKHTNLLDKRAGSWFFLGEIFTDLPLPADAPAGNHCGDCTRCIEACPTRAIVAPYTLDARRCISYLTIEHKGSLPEELRPLMGNRIYGCDDCQLVCPWNRFAKPGSEPDFEPRNGLDTPTLAELFAWSEEKFLRRLEGSPIRRIGHVSWLRNIAVAIGNANPSKSTLETLKIHAKHPSEVVREHVAWAMKRHTTDI